MKALEAKLRKLPQASLVRLVIDIYGQYDDVDDIIESHLHVDHTDDGGPSALHASIARQLDHLLHDDDFIEYRDGYDFSCRLQSLLLDIQNLAEESGPAPALQLLDTIIAAHGEVMQRADDSDGDIGAAFAEAVDLWLSVAAELRATEPDARDWVDCVARFYAANDYGCLDDVIAHSAGLLSDAELRQMAAGFESDARIALKVPANKSDPKSYNHDAAHACLGLKAVGRALRDVALFEKSLLITSSAPNTLQMSTLVEFALEINALDEAEAWLQQPAWKEDKSRYCALNNALLKARGDIKQLKANLYQTFVEQPNKYSLTYYLEYANAKEAKAVAAQVEAIAAKHHDVAQAIDMLLAIQNTMLAAVTLIERDEEFTGTYYTTLLDWVKAFETADETLASILCYRHLLTDLLSRGFSKAYHHGADYFRRLLVLDKKNPDYRQFANAQQFIAMLQNQHWRKRSFWQQAGHAAKPSGSKQDAGAALT